ncbi:MAG: Sec-independent protein translocase protein TatB [Erythrobacter sp.]
MFDLGAAEILVIIIVAIVVIGPKDMPMALRAAGRWIGKVRRVSGHFRSGLDTMIREAELEDMEKKWKEQNASIMAEAPSISDSASAEAAIDRDDPVPDLDGEMTGPTEPQVEPADAPSDDPAAPAAKSGEAKE